MVTVVLLATILFLSWGIARPFRGPGFAAIPIGIVLWALTKIGLPLLFWGRLYSLDAVGQLLAVVFALVVPVGIVLCAMAFEKSGGSRTAQALAQPQNGAYAGGPYPTMPVGTNVMATLSLVFGVLSGSVLAIVFGHVAKSQIRRTREAGNGMATAGLVLGYFWLAATVVLIIIYIVIFVTQLNRSYSYYG